MFMLSLFTYSLVCKHLRAAENLAKNIQHKDNRAKTNKGRRTLLMNHLLWY